jgi:hypothetical protein
MRGEFVNREALAKVSKKVAKQFPEMEGVKPSVKTQTPPGNGREQYLLTFKGKADLPGGGSMSRIVRVVADEKGRVIRMSTSR